MARSINQVILLGRLTRDPEQRTTASGKNVVSFSIAVVDNLKTIRLTFSILQLGINLVIW